MGHLTRIDVDALNHPTTYTYDTSDRVATRTDPLQKQATYGYDKNDHLTQMTDRKQQVTGYQYDDLDRLSVVTFQDGSTVTYTYDAGDRLTQIADSANGNITRGYDNFDRLTSETTPQETISYTYDADGRRATMTVAGQPQIAYGYDDAHRLTSITQGTTVVSMTYDNADRRSTLTYPNGIVATYDYDNANRLTSLAYTLNGNPVGDLTYTYDLAGQRISVGGSWARTGLPQALTSATYDAGNQLLTWGTEAFSYDLNGNIGSDGATSYLWNSRNQLTGLSGAVSASFQYDAIGRRRGKTVSGISTNFLYDGSNFVQELLGTTPTANLVTGLRIDETFMRSDASGTRAVLHDALGSTVALANAAGSVETHYTVEPFGHTTASGTATANAAQFTGRENDFTGLYFYRARYYFPVTQRFISQDPIGLRGGINLYRYALDNPILNTDPLGLETFQIGLSGGFTIPAIGFSPVAFAGIVIDTDGNIGTYWGGGPGEGTGAGAAGGVQIGASNAKTICGIRGPFVNASAGAGPVSADVFSGGGVTGAGMTIGIGTGAATSGSLTGTFVNPLIGRKKTCE